MTRTETQLPSFDINRAYFLLDMGFRLMPEKSKYPPDRFESGTEVGLCPMGAAKAFG
jgi:hypothetical protein